MIYKKHLTRLNTQSSFRGSLISVLMASVGSSSRTTMNGAMCQVRLSGTMMRPYPVEKGVKQGSVFSPGFFLLVMNPLLVHPQQPGLSLSIKNFYAGGFLHDDDIRTLASRTDSLKRQISIVEDSQSRISCNSIFKNVKSSTSYCLNFFLVNALLIYTYLIQ